MSNIRVMHRTVERYGPTTVALAANDGICPECGEPVLRGEPVNLRGKYTEQDADTGRLSIDLSGVWWACQKEG